MPACVVAICRAANWRRAGSIVRDDRAAGADGHMRDRFLIIGSAALADGIDRHDS